jgi:hypothetical protein
MKILNSLVQSHIPAGAPDACPSIRQLETLAALRKYQKSIFDKKRVV